MHIDREYRPDAWKLVKITSEKHGVIYKVLACWYGGFAGSDDWKLSSGIKAVSINDTLITMPQSSGSVYILHTGGEHLSSFMASVFGTFTAEAEKSDGLFTIELVSVAEVVEALK